MRKIYFLLLFLILLPYGMKAQDAYPSTVTVSFSQNGQTVTSVPYGSTVTITATMEKAETATNALEVDLGMVGFYLGEDTQYGILVGTDDVEIVDGVYTAAVDVTLDDEKGVTEVGTITITADFGGYAPEGNESGDSLAPNTGSAELTVTKAEQTEPTGTFFTTSSTENSITVTFTDVTQPENENGIEIAYAVEPTASEPTSDWTTATKSSSGSVYTAEIENLLPGTPHIFFARYKGDDTHEPSPAIASSSAFYTKPKITTQGLPNAYVGVEYSQKLEAEAAEGVAVSWAITSGALPAGLTLSSDGTPTTPTTQAANFSVKATIGEGASSVFSTQTITISVTKSDAELGGLTVSGQTGFDGHFQYGDVITVTFAPERSEGISANALAENTATLTYTSDEGEEVALATATAQPDGSFELSYDTKEKKLPIGENLPLTVSYGGSGALNPVEKELTVTLEQAILKNMPTVTGSFVYGETLTVNYTKQDDESVTYQWYRGGEKISDATENSYTLTAEDISKNIYVIVSATDEWHRGAMQSRQQEVAKAPLDEDDFEITTSESTIELGSEGTILTATITGIEDVNKAENWIWESSNKDIVEVNRLTPEASTTRSADNPIESTARVTPKGVGTATITVIYDSPTYHGEKTYEITVKEKEEEEPEEPVTPDYPDYYNIYVDECEGVTVETSTNVVREGNSMSFTVEVAEGYTAENMTVKVKRSLFGYTDVIEPNEEGKYEIRNIWTEIYITVEGVEKETPTGIEEITESKVYAKDGSLYVQTPKQEEVRIISISGAVIKNETQIGLQRYDLPRGIYIICIGEERVKVRN